MGDIRTMFTAEVSKAASSQSHHSILTAEVKQFESRLVSVSILTEAISAFVARLLVYTHLCSVVGCVTSVCPPSRARHHELSFRFEDLDHLWMMCLCERVCICVRVRVWPLSMNRDRSSLCVTVAAFGMSNAL